ncbi:hypothetical protein MPER_01368 [Moniliophthora perniciosa FA553]|nr:hypothetical protein MPER_01368 [Moniliophthora perniciosa FA553]
MTTFCKQKFAEAPEDVQEDVEARAKKEYDAAMTEYMSRNEWKSDAESYSQIFAKFDEATGPVADSLAMLLGCAVTIVAYGPRDNGTLDVTSMSSAAPEATHKTDLPYLCWARANGGFP